MASIHLYVHGRGLGHAVRSKAVAQRLIADGHQLRVHANATTLAFLALDTNTETLEAFVPGPRLLSRFVERLKNDRKRLRVHPADVLVSDMDAPSIAAARTLGIFSVCMGHGLLYAYAKQQAPLPYWARLREQFNCMSAGALATERVVAHFQPVEPSDAQTLVARPELHLRCDANTHKNEPYVVFYSRDDLGAPILKHLSDLGMNVHAFGKPTYTSSYITWHPRARAHFLSMLQTCTAVVATAGNHLPAECILLEKPLLAFYRPGDFEQQANAFFAQNSGAAMSLCLDETHPAHITRSVTQFVDRVLDGDSFELRRARYALESMPTVSECVSHRVAQKRAVTL